MIIHYMLKNMRLITEYEYFLIHNVTMQIRTKHAFTVRTDKRSPTSKPASNANHLWDKKERKIRE